jgi:small conductance mechanosensitive channel
MPFLLLADAAGGDAAGDGANGVEGLWETVVAFVTTQGVEFGLRLLTAIAVFFIGKWIARFLTSLLGRVMTRSNLDVTLVKFVGNLVYALLLALVVMAALDRLGVDTTSFAAIVAAAGLAVGFALQGSLGNFAAGVMLIIFKPFKVGDFIDAGGNKGTVEEIQIFNTLMRTGDNIQIIVPNGAITGGTISNYSAKPTRRIDLVVGCGYGDDLRAVKQYLEDLLAGDERVLADPAPVVAVSELGDSSVNLASCGELLSVAGGCGVIPLGQ